MRCSSHGTSSCAPHISSMSLDGHTTWGEIAKGNVEELRGRRH
jgi:hypothetical protein